MSNYPEFDQKSQKAIENLAHTFATIRAGQANAAVLDQISVDYYGTATPIAQIGSISTPEPHLLVIQPWDISILKEIEKAIQASDLGLNPTNDGKVIRLAFPTPTEERRKELVKQIHKYAEEAKVAVRNIRRDQIDAAKARKKAGELTEDDLKDAEKDLQKCTDTATKQIEDLTKKKEAEILKV